MKDMKEMYDQWKNRVYLQWHLINSCLNRCVHCYQDIYDGTAVTLQDAILIIEDLVDCCEAFDALPVIALTGGDPMLNEDFWEILSEIRKQSEFACLSVLGNPEQLNTETIKKLRRFKLHHFQLSIDGMEKTHDSIRRKKGSFQRTLQAIRKLSENGVPAYVMSTISNLNYREMFDVMRIAYEYGARHWMFARWIPPKRGDCGIPSDEYIKFVRGIMEEHEQYEERGYKKLRKEPLISIYRNDVARADCDVVSGGCGMGSSTITMLPDKTLMACRRHPDSVIGKWSQEENFLFHFLHNPQMEKYREISRIEGCCDCKLLRFCRGCRAAAYMATGEDLRKDPQCPRPVL